MIYSFVEHTVLQILESSGRHILKRSSEPPVAFDFGFLSANGKRIAVEVKANATKATFAGVMGEQFRKAEKLGYDEFWLVTPGEPEVKRGALTGLATGAKPVHWLSVAEFARALRVAAPLPPAHPSAANLIALNDQLPRRSQVSNLTSEQLDNLLGFGRPVSQAIIVFSDIAKFSTITQHVEPEDLNALLTKYYRLARAKVAEHDGVFDKFIGDAVLAAFNYPVGAVAPFTSAVKYAVELIREGKDLLDDFFAQSVAVVPTGTRIAITCGNVRPIDVGAGAPQISFIGHTVNLAARLQHHAELNGIITCQNTFNRLTAENPDVATRLNSPVTTLSEGTMSGITTAINTHLVSPATVLNLVI